MIDNKFNKPNIILENKFKLIIKNHTWNKNKTNLQYISEDNFYTLS